MTSGAVHQSGDYLPGVGRTTGEWAGRKNSQGVREQERDEAHTGGAAPDTAPAEAPGPASLAALGCQGTDNEAGVPGGASQPLAAATPHAPVRAQARAEGPAGYSPFGGRENTAIHPVE